MTFNILQCAVAGIVATAVMTGFVNSFSFFFAKKFRVVPLLGTMITGETTVFKGISFSSRAVYTGLLAHYLIGCLFSFLFYIWSVRWEAYSLINTLLFGVLAGIAAVITWRLFFYVHSRPPRINLDEYCKLIFIAHIIFAIVLYIVYTI